MKSPTVCTLDYYRRQGFEVGIVERWIERAGIRKDLFGFIDLIAVKPSEPVLAIQATSRANISARIAKAKGIPALAIWLSTGAKFVVIGWAKIGKRWEPRIVELQADALEVKALVTQTPPRKRRKSRFQPADLFGDDVGHPIRPCQVPTRAEMNPRSDISQPSEPSNIGQRRTRKHRRGIPYGKHGGTRHGAEFRGSRACSVRFGILKIREGAFMTTRDETTIPAALHGLRQHVQWLTDNATPEHLRQHPDDAALVGRAIGELSERLTAIWGTVHNPFDG